MIEIVLYNFILVHFIILLKLYNSDSDLVVTYDWIIYVQIDGVICIIFIMT